MQNGKADNYKGNILVVDDEISIRDFLNTFLSTQGYEVVTANDGVDALEKTAHFLPDLVISDVVMPRMNGLELCKKLRQNERTESVPILIMTALLDQDIRSKAIELQVIDILNKPFSLNKLLDTVQNTLDQSNHKRAHNTTAQETGTSHKFGETSWSLGKAIVFA